MSEPLPIDPDAMLARLAVLDMAAAEHAHARLLAAEETKAVAELGRTYQRMARSLRQTLAVLAKSRSDAQDTQRRAAAFAPRPPGERPYFGALTDKADLADAAIPRIRAEYDPSEAEILEDDLSDLIGEVWDDDFADLDPTERLTRLLAHIRTATAAADDDEDEVAAAEVEAPHSPPEDPPQAFAPESPPSTGEEKPEPEPEPPPRPPDPEPKPYIPPWEINPYARYPGGSGW